MPEFNINKKEFRGYRKDGTKYVYHGSKLKNLNGIVENGLLNKGVPRTYPEICGTERKIFFGSCPKVSKAFLQLTEKWHENIGNNTIMLRVKSKNLEQGKGIILFDEAGSLEFCEYTGFKDCFCISYNYKVPPEQIEIFETTTNKWINITKGK